SLYLTQLAAIVLLRKIWEMAELPTAGLGAALVFVVISLAGSIAVGALTYACIERPALGLLRQLLAGRTLRAEGLSGSDRRTAEASPERVVSSPQQQVR